MTKHTNTSGYEMPAFLDTAIPTCEHASITAQDGKIKREEIDRSDMYSSEAGIIWKGRTGARNHDHQCLFVETDQQLYQLQRNYYEYVRTAPEGQQQIGWGLWEAKFRR